MPNIEGVLPDHEVPCPFCEDYVDWCENCGEEEPCEECLSNCPHCEGTGTFRWGSYYTEDKGCCGYCEREEIYVQHQEDGSMSGTWICFDCCVLQHALYCKGCNLWEKWETIDQIFPQIDQIFPQSFPQIKGGSSLNQIKTYLFEKLIVQKLTKEVSRLVENREKVERKIKGLCEALSKKAKKFSPEWDLPLVAYLLSLPGEFRKNSARLLSPHIENLFWVKETVREILTLTEGAPKS